MVVSFKIKVLIPIFNEALFPSSNAFLLKKLVSHQNKINSLLVKTMQDKIKTFLYKLSVPKSRIMWLVLKYAKYSPIPASGVNN